MTKKLNPFFKNEKCWIPEWYKKILVDEDGSIYKPVGGIMANMTDGFRDYLKRIYKK